MSKELRTYFTDRLISLSVPLAYYGLIAYTISISLNPWWVFLSLLAPSISHQYVIKSDPPNEGNK